jgi:hypothetical protein
VVEGGRPLVVCVMEKRGMRNAYGYEFDCWRRERMSY